MKKKGKIGIALVVALVCAATWLLSSRWDVWFGNYPESAYHTPHTPHHVLLTMGNDALSRLVTWQCDTMVQEAFVEYGYIGDTMATLDRLYRVEAKATKHSSPSGSSVFYSASIPTPVSGRYSYRIVHRDVQSQWYDFAVVNMNDSIARFVFIGDIQDTIGGVTKDITQQIVQRHADNEFFLLGGDLIHRPQELYWDELFSGISPFATSYPVMAVSGNHEYLKGLYKVCEERFPLHFAYFANVYNSNDYCFNTLRYDNIELFMLDSHCDVVRLIEQRKKLQDALSESTATWKIVVLHHPPYSIRRKSNNILLRWILTPILERDAVDLVLSGHEHGYARIHPHNDDDATPIYTISHCSPKKYRHRNTEVEMYDNDARYYQYIDCAADTMLMRTYTSCGEIIDSVKCVKQNGKTLVL